MTIPSPGTVRPPAIGANYLCRDENRPCRRTVTCHDATVRSPDATSGNENAEGDEKPPGQAEALSGHLQAHRKAMRLPPVCIRIGPAGLPVMHFMRYYAI